MSHSATVLIASLDPEIQQVWSCLRDEGFTVLLASCGEEALELVASTEHGLLVLDAELPGDEVEQAYQLAREARGLALLLLLPGQSEASCQFSRPASRLEEHVSKPVSAVELALRIKALMMRAGHELPIPPAPVAPTGAAQAPAEDGSLIMVYSAKGGAGKSTLAVNLSVALARAFGRKVLLADADVWYGDIGVLLDIISDKGLHAICAGDEIDLFGLPRAVIPHPSGISVLLRPQDAEQVEQLNPATVARTLSTYRALYDFVVVDSGPTLDEFNLQLLEAADRILLVTTPELTSIHNCSRFLRIAHRLGYGDKIALVINRANSGVDWEAIAHTLELPVLARVVSAGKLVVDAANKGTSVLDLDPFEREQITQDLLRLAERLVGEARPAAPTLPESQKQQRRWQLPFLRRAA